MNAAVLRRGLATGWKGLLVTAAVVAAMLVMALAIYAELDLSIYDKLPEAVRALMGVPHNADAAIIAYNEMLASIGALAFVGVAIAIGAQAVAGEEQDRTIAARRSIDQPVFARLGGPIAGATVHQVGRVTGR